MSKTDSTFHKPDQGSKKPSAYSVDVSPCQGSAGIEELLLLGLSHTDADSANQRVKWMYRANPAGVAVTAIIRHNASQKSVGLLAIARRQFWTPSGVLNTGILCDFVAEKSHRTLGPAIMLIEEALASATSMSLDRIYGWPNPKSLALFSRFKNGRRSEINTYRRYLNWPDKLSEKMPALPAILLGNLLTAVDNCYLKLLQLWVNHRFETRHPDSFDSEFDDLWRHARERYDEIGVRDSCFLRWRFLQSTDYDHRIFSLVSRQDHKIAGYIVYRELGPQFVDISDFLAFDSQGTERLLLSSFCRYMRVSGYRKVSVSFTGNQKTRRNLFLSGFFGVGSQAVVHFQLDNGSVPEPDTFSHVTQADHDVG